MKKRYSAVLEINKPLEQLTNVELDECIENLNDIRKTIETCPENPLIIKNLLKTYFDELDCAFSQAKIIIMELENERRRPETEKAFKRLEEDFNGTTLLRYLKIAEDIKENGKNSKYITDNWKMENIEIK